MDLIGAAGKIISLIETGIQVSDQLKEIAKSEHKLPADVVHLHNNAQQLLEMLEALPSTGIGSSNNMKIRKLADWAKNISKNVIGIMDEINPKWQQKQQASLTLLRSYLKKKDMNSIETEFKHLQEQMKCALLELVCQSSSEARSQYEELHKRVRLGDEHVISIQGSVHNFSQQLHTIQDSIYDLGKQIGSASLAGEEFHRQAVEVLTSEWKLSTILSRLTKEFREKDLKANAISESDPGTFDWITQGSKYCHKDPDNVSEKERLGYQSCDSGMLQHHIEASNNFRSFLQRRSGAFLILGKPGSGKSTLMKYLMHNPLVLQDLKQWAAKKNKKLIRAIFFFSVTQGSGVLSSEESIYRSLLFQILRECPDLVDDILPGEANLSASIPLPSEAVQRAIRCLFSSKSNVAEKYCFCLFIDGLDDELTHRLVEWCQGEVSNTKIIFSSRVIPALDSRFPANKKILLYVHTKRDILQSAFSNFKKHPEAIPDDYVELSEIISDQAQGIFLWARLVIKDILEALTDGVAPETFQKIIEETPTDIEDLYAKILDRVKEHDREASAVILRLAAFQPAGFRINLLACAWLDRLKDPNFPCDEPAKFYDDDEISQQRKRAIRRLAALTHGLLESQDMQRKYGAYKGSFFHSEIVFLHRTAQDFVRSLLVRDREDAILGILPWLQGNDNVSADEWSQCWRKNLFVRIFHAEVRFGMLRGDDNGKPHKDLCDFGFWAETSAQLQPSDFKSLSEFSSFSTRYRDFCVRNSRTGCILYNSSTSTFGELRDLPHRFSLLWALYEGQNVPAWIEKRHLPRRLIAQLAAFYANSGRGPVLTTWHVDGLKGLLQNGAVCATDKCLVWHKNHLQDAMDELLKARRADQGHIDETCSCDFFNAGSIRKYGKYVQTWLFFLHRFGNQFQNTATLDRNIKGYCQMLELWLRYGATTDAIILITSKDILFDKNIGAEDISYVEIEQLLHQLREMPFNFQDLQYLLARRHSSWASWITDRALWAWSYCPRLQKKPSTIPIRNRYRHMSNQDLRQLDWKVYGVISDDDELLGNFYLHII